MNKLKQLLIFFSIIFISFNLNAGASDDVKTNSEDFETSIVEDEIYDPLEGINRAIFGFNSPYSRNLVGSIGNRLFQSLIISYNIVRYQKRY